MPGHPSLLPTHLHQLVIPTIEAAFDRIFEVGMETAPDEACGILVREGEKQFRIVQLNNRAPDPRRAYAIDVATLRQISFKPELWSHVRVWHTHPGGMVGPSPGDLENKVPGVKYLVITIPTGEVVAF